MATLGVAVFCVAGMKHVDRCLASAAWADDVDVIRLEEGKGFPCDPASLRAAQRTDWVLHLWGDEIIEEKLAQELSSLRGMPLRAAATGYRIPVRSSLLGKWIDGSFWGPTPSLRLTRERGCWPAAWWNPARMDNGHIGRLAGSIKDYSAAELGPIIGHMNTVTTFWAEALNARAAAPGLTYAAMFSVFILGRQLISPRRLRDGFAGLALAVLAAYTALLVGAKAWEQSNSAAASRRADLMAGTAERPRNNPGRA